MGRRQVRRPIWRVRFRFPGVRLGKHFSVASQHLSWALRISSGVGEGIHHSVVQSGGEFLHVGVAGGPGKTLGRQP